MMMVTVGKVVSAWSRGEGTRGKGLRSSCKVMRDWHANAISGWTVSGVEVGSGGGVVMKKAFEAGMGFTHG